jgi:membrane protein
LLEESVNYLKGLISYTFSHYAKDRSSSVAAELTVTTLLAIVPFTAVVFALIAFVPGFDNHVSQLQSSFFNYFVPSTGETVKVYINEFVAKAKNLSGVGILALIVTALLMMRTIDTSFNKIWRAKRLHSVIRTFLVYWAVLSLGPLLLGSSLLITTYIKSLLMLSDTLIEHNHLVSFVIPFMLAVMSFSLMYFVIPNRKVLLSHALIAGIITALLFELAKFGFGIFVTRFSTYQVVFGALAVIPLFLIWLYLSWSIILLGAHLCHALSSYETKKLDKEEEPFIKLVKCLIVLSKYQKAGSVLTSEELTLSSEVDRNSLNELASYGLVMKSEEGSYCLIKAEDKLDYATLYKMVNRKLPSVDSIQNTNLPEETKADLLLLLERVQEAVKGHLVIHNHQ